MSKRKILNSDKFKDKVFRREAKVVNCFEKKIHLLVLNKHSGAAPISPWARPKFSTNWDD